MLPQQLKFSFDDNESGLLLDVHLAVIKQLPLWDVPHQLGHRL